jgi:hypothetical protein
MANPLALVEGQRPRPTIPTDKRERERLWIERGNRILWGQEPTSKGDHLPPRTDLEWRCANGSYFITKRTN